jgi:3-dehydroquinate synthase
MSDMTAKVIPTKEGFQVEGYEKIEYGFHFQVRKKDSSQSSYYRTITNSSLQQDNVFSKENNDLAKCYERWGRVLAVMDSNIFDVYGEQIEAYFEHHKLDLKIHKTMIGEKAKSMETLLSIVDSMTEFGIFRKV